MIGDAVAVFSVSDESPMRKDADKHGIVLYSMSAPTYRREAVSRSEALAGILQA